MDFRIADTFTDSLASLTGDEQKAVKTTAFDLQMNPANPGMQFHRLNKPTNFCSVPVSGDIRLIVHRSGPFPRGGRKKQRPPGGGLALRSRGVRR